jgi:HEAT repeats/AAA+ lid domain
MIDHITNLSRSFDPAVLVSELESLDVNQREKARRTLAALGSAALPELTQALNHPAEWVRWEAATSLALIADPSTAPALTAALQDSSPAVRLAAAEALTEIGLPACPGLIEALNQNFESETLREGAHRVLQALELRGKLARPERDVYAGLHGLLPEEDVRDLTRLSILRLHTRSLALDYDVNLISLARSTTGMSGTDLAALCRNAEQNAADNSHSLVGMADFQAAMERYLLDHADTHLIDEA